jgi:hypothetical protein
MRRKMERKWGLGKIKGILDKHSNLKNHPTVNKGNEHDIPHRRKSPACKADGVLP